MMKLEVPLYMFLLPGLLEWLTLDEDVQIVMLLLTDGSWIEI